LKDEILVGRRKKKDFPSSARKQAWNRRAKPGCTCGGRDYVKDSDPKTDSEQPSNINLSAGGRQRSTVKEKSHWCGGEKTRMDQRAVKSNWDSTREPLRRGTLPHKGGSVDGEKKRNKGIGQVKPPGNRLLKIGRDQRPPKGKPISENAWTALKNGPGRG